MSGQTVKVLGLVGARSGSKGMPDKNIAPLAGKPLMGWIIEATRRSRYVNRIVLSTDSRRYAEIGNALGAETPFLRPSELAADHSIDTEYVTHALTWLRDHEGYVPDLVVRVIPTCPLQAPEDIDACVEILLQDPSADSCMVIAESKQPLHKALRISDDGRHLVSALSGRGSDANPSARQTFPPTYFRANVVAVRPRVVLEQRSLSGERVRYHIIPRDRAIDIDSDVDFFIAEQLITRMKLGR